MRHDPLAPFRGSAFLISSARDAGIGRKRVDSHRLDRPFAGVRTFEPPQSVLALCDAYRPRMAPHEFFSHRTAALLHGMWLPLAVERRMVLDVSVVKPHRAPRDARVVGHHLIDRPSLVWSVKGHRATNPVETLCQLATLLDDEELIVAAEALLPPRKPEGRAVLDRMLAACSDSRRWKSSRLARVAPRIRIGSRSAQETRMRLLLIAAGLPEPQLNFLPQGAGEEWTEGDLVYPEQKVWIEVEGDHHRTDKEQWRKDIVRYERLTDLGWRVIRVTAADIDRRPQETVRRIARALDRAR